MQFAIDRMRRDSDLAKEVLRRHTQVSPEEVDRLFGTTSVILSSSEAAAMGLVHDILDLNDKSQHQENVRIASISWQPQSG
jgi:ATP-dependent protease ClpP protease subunit